MFAKTLALFAGAALVAAESHTISFNNRCGKGEPVVFQNFQQLNSGGGSYTFNGPAPAVIAYLQDGSCGASGENCSLMELTLINGGVSSADVSLIPPHTYSTPVGFAYNNGCDGQGKTCASADCAEAFHVTDDYGAQVQCTANDVNLQITFC
ncbi:hypothetical protein BD626DRAFT_484864 [Schizophyllum amplum]|uniref:Glycopeptide n=1 Tax=Schizophyllum amplum TaxID=97359 RepID=A0A550CQS0_9AGAR|nr:hypothetical protein BD626DRAFT_484864 [Auriculariopsis ampla]